MRFQAKYEMLVIYSNLVKIIEFRRMVSIFQFVCFLNLEIALAFPDSNE